MQFGIISGARAHWYDRSVGLAANSYSAQTGGHAETPRVAYQVPVATKFRFTEFSYSAVRRAAGAPTAQSVIKLDITTDALGLLYRHEEVYQIAAVGDSFRISFPVNMIILPEYYIIISTTDTSTGGNVDYNANAFGNEYAA